MTDLKVQKQYGCTKNKEKRKKKEKERNNKLAG
jgi:hypothetical protein